MSRQSDTAKPIGVIDMNSIYTNEAIPFKFGYTDKMPATLDQVVSPHDDQLLLQYFPPAFMFKPTDRLDCTRENFKQFVSGPRKWSTADLERHDDLISHERVVGRQNHPGRRLCALLAIESIFLIDDLVEPFITSEDKVNEKMAFDIVKICRDIKCGTAVGLDQTFVSLYKDRFPEEYEGCQYLADFNARFYQLCKKNLSPKMLSFVADVYYRSYGHLIGEYEFWQGAKLENQHAPLKKFIEIKTGASYFAVNQIINYYDTDIDYINFDHPILTMATLVNQASNDLYSYPKEQEAGVNPFNMIQKAIMADKMTMKEALVANIQRRNEYMRALETSYDVLRGDARTAALAPLTLLAPWEKYFSETRRYGWTKTTAIKE
ncbi:hypothetical protein HDE_05746 [Halotydeus destructor]|nr:hypothetical protein HDE_05746 [Halotydeus destructor]